MGQNFKSFRIRDLKTKLERINKRTDCPFTKQLALLRELLTIQTISIPNCRWARKYINEHMREMYGDQRTIAEMEALELLFAKAEERRERRKLKKQAMKKQQTKEPAPTKTTAPAPGEKDIWDF